MKKILVFACASVFFSSLAFAAGPATYQVTGPVLEVKDNMVTVQKGKERWQIATDASTKVTGVLKVGSKVTIEYTMKAVSIDVKEAGKR